MQEKEEPLTAQEAAAYLKCAVGTIHNLVYQKRLEPCGRFGNRLRFKRQDLDRFLTEPRKGGPHV